MMPADDARVALDRWGKALNARDLEGMVATMHFPHVRLAGGRFQTWQTADDFGAGHDAGTERLREEGWDQTVQESVDTVHEGPDKVHFAIRMSRRRQNGSEYRGFDTLWIFTLIDGRWGVQFRSSYLG